VAVNIRTIQVEAPPDCSSACAFAGISEKICLQSTSIFPGNYAKFSAVQIIPAFRLFIPKSDPPHLGATHGDKKQGFKETQHQI
jgi:hypothetical protein